MTKPSAAKGTNTSTRHVFEALYIITQSDEPIDLPRLAGLMSLPNSTAHRALMTLEECGMARRVEGGARFVAGDMVHHLIRSMVVQYPIRNACADALRALCEDLDLTVTLNCRLGWNSIRLFSVEGSRESYQMRRIGEVRPLHDGVGPRTILAALSAKEQTAFRKRLRQSGGLGGRKPDLALLTKDANACRQDGYIIQPPSDYTALSWLCFPVYRPDGAAAASVSAGLIPSRLEDGGLQEIADACMDRIAALQAKLDRDAAHTALPYGDQPPEALELTVNRVLPMKGLATGT